MLYEVITEEGWEMFDYKTGNILKPEHFFVWQRGNDALLRTKGVDQPKLRFSITETQVPITSTMTQESYGET